MLILKHHISHMCMYVYVHVHVCVLQQRSLVPEVLRTGKLIKSAKKSLGVVTSSAAIVESGCKIRVEFQE